MSKTKTAKPTPGPWKVRDGVDEYFIDAPGQVVCLAVVNKCINAPERAPESAANARLIAAAPGLVAALREFMTDIEAVGLKALKDENDANYWPDLVPTYRHAKAALKEAGL